MSPGCFCSLAQNQYVTISGKLTDSESGDPLPFASIGIDNTSIGTITNNDGEFDFHYSSDLSGNNLIIRMLGYEELSLPLSSYGTDHRNILLNKTSLFLDEVVIVDSLLGGDILRIALSRIEDNYPMQEYSMLGFYRDLKKVNGEYISLLEAALEIYDKDYSEPRNPLKLRERVGLKEVRKSLNYEFAFKKYFDQYNLLEELLLENNIKYRSFTSEQVFYDNLKRDSITNIGNNAVYKLSLFGDLEYELVLFIDTENYGIHKLTYKYGDGTQPIEEINRSGKRAERIMKKNKSIEFNQFDGKYYLKYLRVNTNYEWIDLKNNVVEATTELFQELLINQIEITSPNWISTGEKMKRYGLQYQDMPYNKEFWDNYNVIKDTPLDLQIVKDLQKYGSLNSQFQNN